MKKSLLLFSSIAALLISCGTSNNSEPTAIDSGEVAKVMIPQSSCFASFSGKDTILLKLEVFPNVVTGVLKYQIWEKDKNEGTIDGKLEGNQVIAEYSFSSEGKTSIREVAFLIDGDTVTEGFGEMTENNGKMVFKNRASIDFTKGIRLTKIDCVENDSKFRLNP